MSHSVEVCLLFKMKILFPYLIVVISVCDFWHKILFCDLNCSFSFNHWMLLEKVLKPSIKGISWIIFLLVSGSGLEVSVLVIYSNDPSSYPTVVKSFYSAIILKDPKTLKRAGDGPPKKSNTAHLSRHLLTVLSRHADTLLLRDLPSRVDAIRFRHRVAFRNLDGLGIQNRNFVTHLTVHRCAVATASNSSTAAESSTSVSLSALSLQLLAITRTSPNSSSSRWSVWIRSSKSFRATDGSSSWRAVRIGSTTRSPSKSGPESAAKSWFKSTASKSATTTWSGITRPPGALLKMKNMFLKKF